MHSKKQNKTKLFFCQPRYSPVPHLNLVATTAKLPLNDYFLILWQNQDRCWLPKRGEIPSKYFFPCKF